MNGGFHELNLGAHRVRPDAWRFLVWAPAARSIELRIPGRNLVPMTPVGGGYFDTTQDDLAEGDRYSFIRNGEKERADPASRRQPEGVHGPSALVSSQYPWSDAGWTGIPLTDAVFYELHVGTFTREGTFASVIPELPYLKDLGIRFLELMPLAQFPGTRNWGYDGACPFAVQESYGGAEGLRLLVDACHREGLGVALDVVYNHLGPEGNYLPDFGPYFTDRYRTPWGQALNFDGPGSDEVRRYFIENALSWIRDFHIDALRLDAVHAITDLSALPFLEELREVVHDAAGRLGRHVQVIAESDSNDPRLVRGPEQGGIGLDAQWNDDFHHALHTLMVSERSGYYQDFEGLALARALREGFVFQGEPSGYRRRRHGRPSRDVPRHRWVVFGQNHDQVGNRRCGERLSHMVPLSDCELAAAACLLSPCTPLLFMGEEYGETSPFLYFVSHGDPDLIEAVRKGRKAEFAAFCWVGDPPDPQDPESFLRSKLNPALRDAPGHRELRYAYRSLLSIRREKLLPLLKAGATVTVHASEPNGMIRLQYESDRPLTVVLNFSADPREVGLEPCTQEWRLLLGRGEVVRPDPLGGGGITWFDAAAAGPRSRTLRAPARSFAVLEAERRASEAPERPVGSARRELGSPAAE